MTRGGWISTYLARHGRRRRPEIWVVKSRLSHPEIDICFRHLKKSSVTCWAINAPHHSVLSSLQIFQIRCQNRQSHNLLEGPMLHNKIKKIYIFFYLHQAALLLLCFALFYRLKPSFPILTEHFRYFFSPDICSKAPTPRGKTAWHHKTPTLHN